MDPARCDRRIDPTDFTVTYAFDVDLSDDEHYSLGGHGCRVDGLFDRSVVAILSAPTVRDDRGAVQAARRAWSYSQDGLQELDPSRVACEPEEE